MVFFKTIKKPGFRTRRCWYNFVYEADESCFCVFFGSPNPSGPSALSIHVHEMCCIQILSGYDVLPALEMYHNFGALICP